MVLYLYIAKWHVHNGRCKLILFITLRIECCSDVSCLHIPVDKKERINGIKDIGIVMVQ